MHPTRVSLAAKKLPDFCVNSHWIDSPDILRQHFLSPPPQVGLDTEFVRERTWWPKLALVQIATPDAILLVDPCIPGMPEAIAQLLAEPRTLKIMHSPGEDLLALGATCNALPAPLFDTQTAAALCGIGSGLGYQKLTQTLLEIALEKSETRSDWLQRPLSPAQLEYAADDVRYLEALHRILRARLEALSRLDWLEEDCERMLHNALEAPEPWPHRDIRPAQDFPPDAQARLLRLLRWRETSARNRNRPRNWILEQPLALHLAERPPRDFAQLERILERTPKAPRKLARELWQTLQTPLEDEALMPPVRHERDLDKAKLKKLQKVVSELACELNIPEGLLASRRWLIALMEAHAAKQPWPSALQGWRQALLETRIAEIL